MSQMYFGVLPFLLILTHGLMRRQAWTREVRVFAAATVLLLLYAIGRHTPIFHLFYDYVPGVKLFRRPGRRHVPHRRLDGDPRRLSRPPGNHRRASLRCPA